MPRGTITVRPVLAHEPVFWTQNWWAEEARACEGVRPETPLDEKPWAELEVSLDVTLGEVWSASCDAWGIRLGPDAHGSNREDEFWRFSFVRPHADAYGLRPADLYQWPDHLPVAREDGTVEQARAFDIPYRDLLVASSLGLIEGDVLRPYVVPVRPQGDVGTLIELSKVTAEVIRAAYAGVDESIGASEHTLRLVYSSLPTADHVAVKVAQQGSAFVFFYKVFKWCRGKLGDHTHHTHKSGM